MSEVVVEVLWNKLATLQDAHDQETTLLLRHLAK